MDEATRRLNDQAIQLLDAGPEAVRTALAELGEGKGRDLLEGAIEAARTLREAQAIARERLEENQDGTIVVKLAHPVRVGDDELSRVTVGRVKVKHLRATRTADDALDAYADLLVSPEGAVGEVETDQDYTAILLAVEMQLGKYRRGGERS